MKKIFISILLFPLFTSAQQYLRPDADNTVNSWTTTPLFSKVNESTADDATTFIRNASGNTTQVELNLSNPTGGTNVKGLRILFARALASGSGGAEVLTIYLYQGTTLIATSAATTISRSVWTNISYTLTSTEENNITDYSNLRIRMAMTSGGASEFIEVTQCYLSLPVSSTIQAENLLTYSEQVSNEFSSNSLNISTITEDVTTDPISTTTADIVIPNTTSSNTHRIQTNYIGFDNQDYTFSVYAKSGTYSGLQLGSASATAVFDLSSGTTSSLNATITSIGSGWYRCSFSFYYFIGTSLANMHPFIYVFNTAANASSNTAYAGNGTDGIYVWGTMLQRGTDATTSGTPTTYIKVPAGGATNKPKFFLSLK
jgi:hypothetical protein